MNGATSLVDLLRHGQTEGGAAFRGSTDDRLSQRGMAQMWTAVRGPQSWQCIIASPLRRCAEFACALAERLGVSVEIDERLREIHFGAWEGRTAEEITGCDAEALRRFWADPIHHPPPGAEAVPAFQARVLSCWQDQLRKREGSRILVVTHGGPIRAILGEVYRVSWTDLLRLDLPHASLTRVCVEHAPDGGLHAALAASVGSPC